MACDPQTTITTEQLSNLNTNTKVFNEVVTSPLDQTPTQASDGESKLTLNGALKRLGYQPPVVYAAGITFTSNDDNTKTIERNGIIYAPLPSQIPFTTSGTWTGDDENKFFVVQGITTSSLPALTDLVFDSVADMQSGTLRNGGQANFSVGDIVTTKAYMETVTSQWTVVSSGAGDMTDATLSIPGGLFAKLNTEERWVSVYEFGATNGGGQADADLNTTAWKNLIANCDWCIAVNGDMYVNDGGADDYTLYLRSNQLIYMGNDFTIRMQDTAKGRYGIFAVQQVNNCRIVGGNLIGDFGTHLGTTGEQGYGIAIFGAINLKIYDVRLSKMWGDGIVVSGITGVAQGVDVEIDGCTVTNVRRNGITVGHVSGCHIHNCTLDMRLSQDGTPPMACLDVEPDSGQTAKDVHIYNNKMLGMTYQPDWDNDTEMTARSCIQVFGGTGAVNNCNIYENELIDGRRSILVSGTAAENITIRNNPLVTNAYEECIYAVGTSKDVKIVENEVIGGKIGIYCRDLQRGSKVTANTLRDQTGAASIQSLRCLDIEINDNKGRDGNDAFIIAEHDDLSAGYRATVTDNECKDYGGQGYRITKLLEAEMNSNRAFRVTGRAFVIDESNRVSAIDNVSKFCSAEGVYVTNSTETEVIGGSHDRATTTGVSINTSVDTVVTNVTVSNLRGTGKVFIALNAGSDRSLAEGCKVIADSGGGTGITVSGTAPNCGVINITGNSQLTTFIQDNSGSATTANNNQY